MNRGIWTKLYKELAPNVWTLWSVTLPPSFHPCFRCIARISVLRITISLSSLSDKGRQRASALTELSCLSTDNQRESFASMALYYIKATPITKLWHATHNKNRKVKMEREGEKGGIGFHLHLPKWRWASMSDHVGDGTWTITHLCVCVWKRESVCVCT